MKNEKMQRAKGNGQWAKGNEWAKVKRNVGV
jgi:hypothetical protein